MMHSGLKILYIDFPTQYLLTSTLLRFEECFESPEFAGKVFTLEAYMDWYAAKNGNFTYYSDWTGFNIPSYAFRPFREGAFDPLSRKEMAMLDVLRETPEPFYLIATFEGQTDVLVHEIMHGLYYCDGGYRKLVDDVMDGYRAAADEFGVFLGKSGYGRDHFSDETNAYAMTGYVNEMPARLRWKMRPLRRELLAIFHERYGIDLRDKKQGGRLLEFVTQIPYAELERRIRR